MPKTYPDDYLLTPSEVGAAMRVDPKTVTRWAAAGKMPAIRTPGGHRRFYWVAVRAALLGDDPWEAVKVLELNRQPHNPTPPRLTPATLNPTTTTTADARYYLDRPTR